MKSAESTLEKIKDFKNITIVACGTAMHAGMVGKYVIEDLARIPVNVDIASEFRYRNPIVGEGDLVIIFLSRVKQPTVLQLCASQSKGVLQRLA